jgi:type II secretory pathway pseudopilin PulG
MRRPTSQRGDTLVEVVVSMAILSVVLASGFSLASSSYNIGREARERTEAANLAQQQAELLTQYRDWLIDQTKDTNSDLFTTATDPVTGTNHFPANGTTFRMKDSRSWEPCPTGCQTSLYSVTITPFYATGGDKMTARVTVGWESAVSHDDNTTTFDLVMVDSRGIQPRNCEVATNPSCLN